MGEAFLEPQDVERVDGEDADATRSAPGLADEPVAAAPFAIEQGGIDDLDKFLVLLGELTGHWLRIP
jgi:hypothetical protein